MAIFTAARIFALAPKVAPAIAEKMALALERDAARFEVDSLDSRASFMANASHESAGFTRFVENLRYTNPERLDEMFSAVKGTADARALIKRGAEAIANRVYGGRNGNGPEVSGDGWRFRGRGLFQLTGRSNYAAAAAALGRPYVEKPDLVAEPDGAVLTALWFWKKNGCRADALRRDDKAVTRKINGPALAGLAERVHLTEAARKIFV